jgi:hypothetical protein
MKRPEEAGMADAERVARSLRRWARREGHKEAEEKLTWLVDAIKDMRRWRYTAD